MTTPFTWAEVEELKDRFKATTDLELLRTINQKCLLSAISTLYQNRETLFASKLAAGDIAFVEWDDGKIYPLVVVDASCLQTGGKNIPVQFVYGPDDDYEDYAVALTSFRHVFHLQEIGDIALVRELVENFKNVPWFKNVEQPYDPEYFFQYAEELANL